MRHRADKNGRGAHTFSSPPPNQPQQTWGPTGQGQHVAVQQHHALPVPQQQQQQQYQQQVQSQHQQQQSPWGVVIMQGSPSPSIGQQQQLQQQQQQQTWGAQHAQQHPVSQLPQQGTTQFALSVNQPQSYGAQGQQNHGGASNGHQHQLQGIYPVNPSQPQAHLQAWTAQPSSAQRTPSHYGSNHSQSMMSSNSGGGGGGSSSTSGTMVLPWGQQLQTGGYSPTAPIVSSASGGSSWQGSSRPKFNSSTSSTKFNSGTSSTKFNSSTSSTKFNSNTSSTSMGRSFDGGGGKSGHRSFYPGQRTRATPPPSPRADMAAGKRGRKRKPRAVTETMPANKRTPHHAKGGGGGSKGRQAASGKGGGGASSGGTGSQDAKAGDGVKILPCEPCEKEFTTELARIAHLDAHVRCEEPGCGFSALRKIVSLHHDVKHGQFSGSGFQVVDLEGQKFRVLLGGCPEEVEQWRAARKKLWPTNANIARKNEETKTRKQLGDPGPDPGQAGRGRGKDRGQGSSWGREKGGGEGQAVPNPASADEAQENAGVALKRENGDVEGKTPAKVAKLSSEGGGEKASMDVDGLAEAGTGMEVKQELDAGADSEAAARDRPKKLCSFYLRGTCGKGEACTFSHDVERKPCSYFMKGRCKWGNKCNFMHDPAARTQAKLESRNAVEDAPGSSGKEKQAGKRVKAEREAMQRSQSKPTLLRKLLAPQLHRESSIALQAVRFIVGSNFFLDPAAARADGDPSSFTAADGAAAGDKHDVEAGGGQSVASVPATGAAGTGGGTGTATESIETADAADAVGEKPDHMEEEDDSHPTVEPGSSPNGASAEVPRSAATIDADASAECVDTTAVSSAAAATSTNGKPLGGDTKVEEGRPGDAVPATSEPVVAAGDQGGKATGINQSGEENSPRAVEEGSAASAVAPETAAAAALSSEADSCDTASAAARSTDEVPPKGNLTPAVAPEIAAVAGTGSDTETDDTAATPNTNGLPPDEGKSRGDAKNDDVHQAVGKESAQSVAVAGATADTSNDSVAAAAGTKTGGLPEGDQKA